MENVNDKIVIWKDDIWVSREEMLSRAAEEEIFEEGKEEGIKQAALNLLKNGFDIDFVSQNINLSKEEVEELAQSINEEESD